MAYGRLKKKFRNLTKNLDAPLLLIFLMCDVALQQQIRHKCGSGNCLPEFGAMTRESENCLCGRLFFNTDMRQKLSSESVYFLVKNEAV